jgi:hypothetical protein
VPEDYANSDGQPTSIEARTYQKKRGRGDGRRLIGVVPLSLRPATQTEEVGEVGMVALRAPLMYLNSEAPLARFADLSSRGVTLCLLALAAQPLVYAHLDGFTVIGMELSELHIRGSVLRLVCQWVNAMAGAVQLACFLVGEFIDGPRVAALPLELTPDAAEVVRTPEQRRGWLRRGRKFAWCTLAALAGCITADPAGRAVAATSSFTGPTEWLADATVVPGSSSRAFRFGRLAATPLDKIPRLREGVSPLGWTALLRANKENALLRDRLLHVVESDAADMAAWADRLSPFNSDDIPPALLQKLPTFEDAALDRAAFTKIRSPPLTTWLPRAPKQRAVPGKCPLSPLDLMPASTQQRLLLWLRRTLDDLVCIRDEGDACERHRPPPIAIGQSELFPWARGVVWDFTFERSSCGVPLDFTLPIETHLNVAYLAERLNDYPDQRLLSYLLEGVRLEADVELQTVLVPHLMSLPKGYASVRKEL